MTDPTKTLIILAGLSGSGKSTVAKTFLDPLGSIFSTDDYPNLYNSDGSFNGMDPDPEFGVLIGRAHNWNQTRAHDAMASGVGVVVIDNTNLEHWEFAPYLESARKFGYVTTRVDIFDGGCTDKELAARNRHGVPQATIAEMRERYQKNGEWEDASPLPPWER